VEGRPGRAFGPALLLVRCALGAALVVLAATAVGAAHQRTPALVLVPAATFLVAALARPGLAAFAGAALVPLLPVAGNLLRGPWVAPAELVLLLLAAAILFRHRPAPPSALGTAIAVSAGLVAVGAVAATLAALAPAEVPSALRELSRSFFSPGRDHAALPLRAALVHAAGLLGFLLFRRASAERGAGSLLAAVVAGLAAVGLYSLIEASTGLKLWPAGHYEAHSLGLRVPSTLPDYNATGAVMALGLFPALALARQARGRRRLALSLASVLLLAGLLLSGSRTAWLAALLAAGVTLAAALRSRREGVPGEGRRLVLNAGLALGLSVAAVAVWPGDVGQLLRRRAATLLDPGEAAKGVRAGRLAFWIAGTRMVASHPLAGVGPGRVPSRFPEFVDAGFPVRSENLHAYPLQALAENGIPGGLLALWPFVPLALLAGRAIASGTALSSPVLALAPGLLAFTLTGAASHPWLLPEMQFLFWGAAALLASGVPEPLPSRALSPARLLPWLFLLWAVPRLLLAPGTERSRFGFAEWGSRGGEPGYFWTGPSALVPVALPADGVVVVRARVLYADVRRHPVLLAVSLDGGPVAKVSLSNRTWQDVLVERGPLRPGSSAGRGGPEGLLLVEGSRAFCPSLDGGVDRRLLSLQLARPVLRTPAEPVP
jgi:O-antigen ligase